MDETPAGVSDGYRRASPWPVFVALGIPIAELGILFNSVPVSVGGLLLFCGSATGMLQESGYVESPWRALVGFAVLLFGVGALFIYSDLALVTRGYAIIATGAMLLLGGVVGELFVDDPHSV